MPDPTRSFPQALRELPVPSPPEDGWRRLQGATARPAAPPSRRWAAAAGMLLALALGWLLIPPQLPPQSAAPSDATPPAPTLAELRLESARWELLLASLDAPVDSVASASLRMALVERIALIDVLLGEPASPTAQAALWSERVLLLRELVRLRGAVDSRLAAFHPIERAQAIAL